MEGEITLQDIVNGENITIKMVFSHHIDHKYDDLWREGQTTTFDF